VQVCGVELDRKALAKLHQNYLACGLTKRDDEIEMQRVTTRLGF
jgi:glucarate dehydratase